MTLRKPVGAFLIFVALTGCGKTASVETVAPVTTTSTSIQTTTTIPWIPTPEWTIPTTTTPPTTVPVVQPTTPRPPVMAPSPKPQVAPQQGNTNGFLGCVKNRESKGQYTAVNRSSGAGGAYQFLPNTWNNTAKHAGRADLVGKNPSQVSPRDQDAMAQHLYQWQGRGPWNGPGC